MAVHESATSYGACTLSMVDKVGNVFNPFYSGYGVVSILPFYSGYRPKYLTLQQPYRLFSMIIYLFMDVYWLCFDIYCCC